MTCECPLLVNHLGCPTTRPELREQQLLNSNAHCGMSLMDVLTAQPRLGLQGIGWDCSPELVLCFHSTARDKAGHRTLGRDRERSVQTQRARPNTASMSASVLGTDGEPALSPYPL